mgnify:CR=1 FL=1
MGKSDAGVKGGPPGDLYVVLTIKAHPVFKRDGYHVYSQHEVTFSQLALGDDIEVPVLKGAERIRIPSGTQNGHIFTLKGLGIPHINNPNRRGDHFVEVKISVPTQLSGEEKKLLQRLNEIQLDKLNKRKESGKHGFMGKVKEALSGNP